MNIFITGGTGLVGSLLVPVLQGQGHAVTVLSRSPAAAMAKFGGAVTCAASLDAMESLDGFDAVINLAGEPIVGKRWTDAQKDRLARSRWDITSRLSELILAGSTPPAVFVSGSAVGYYGKQGDATLTEDSPPHEEFTHFLCKEWEQRALRADSAATRVCIVRTGIVLSAQGGMLTKLLPVFRWGLGAVLGTGHQYISWVHRQDLVNILCLLVHAPDARGIFNASAPNPVTNRVFSVSLALALGRPCLFTLPAWVLSMALGESATLLLDGQRVIPSRVRALGYNFTFDLLHDAFAHIVSTGQ